MRVDVPGATARANGPAWAGAAFVVEAMLLLVFLAASLAVAAQLFGGSVARAAEGEDLARAVAAASEVAERFAADPAAASGESEVDGMRVVCDVQDEERAAGTLYRAVVSVYTSEGAAEPAYSVSTARYVGQVVP